MRVLMVVCLVVASLASVSVEAKILKDTYKFGSKKGEIKTTPQEDLEGNFTEISGQLIELNTKSAKQNETMLMLLAAHDKNTARLAKALSVIAKLQNENNSLQKKIVSLLAAKE
jgi:high-affinity Fe2+/Pb2+ permease